MSDSSGPRGLRTNAAAVTAIDGPDAAKSAHTYYPRPDDRKDWMKLTGSHKFNAPAEEVYDRLLDPTLLRRCMPGCERLEQVDETRFELRFSAPVPAIKGSFDGTVEVLDPEPPKRFLMRIEATGKSGFVNVDARIRIDPESEQSTVHYDADAEVGGLAASVGQRVLTGISRRQVQQMMQCLDRGQPGPLARFLEWLRAKLGRDPDAGTAGSS